MIAQDVFPESSWYHSGSYAGLLLGLLALQWWALRRRHGEMLAIFGATIVTVAGLASSLFAPATQLIVAGPGQTINLSEPAGSLQFPVVQPPGAPALHRPGKSDITLDMGGRRTYLANYIVWTRPRTAAYVEAFDNRGAHLTITQPQATNVPFLSPVLLFLETKEFKDATGATPANLPVDTFSLPAAHRTVNAVLFGTDVIAKMQRLSSDSRPGILFAVSGDRDQPLRDAIGLARSGEVVELGGVRLRPVVESFPTVVIASGPYLPVTVLGLLLFFKNRFRWRT